MKKTTCKNCDTTFEGDYCSNCGQKSNVQRINYKYLVDEISNSLFQLNHGLLFTIKELFTRPGHSIREFLEGKRKRHYKPLAFVLTASVTYFLWTYLMGQSTFLNDAITGYNNVESSTTESLDMRIIIWLTNNQTYLPLLFLPFFSLASYIAFKKSKYNYFEHLVLNAYITGQQLIIFMILSSLFFKDNFLLLIPFVLVIVFNFWTFIQFFKNKKFFTKIALIVFMYILYSLFFMLIFGLTMALALVI